MNRRLSGDESSVRVDERQRRHHHRVTTLAPLTPQPGYLPGRNAQYESRNRRFLRLTLSIWTSRAGSWSVTRAWDEAAVWDPNRSSGCGHRPAPSDAAALRPALADRDAGRNRARPAVLGASPGSSRSRSAAPSSTGDRCSSSTAATGMSGRSSRPSSSGSRSTSPSSDAASGAPCWCTSRRSRSSPSGTSRP